MTDARMAALEAVADELRIAVACGAISARSPVAFRLADLDALSAPAQGGAVECWEHESGSINFIRAGSSDAATLAKTKYWRRSGTVTLPIRVEGGGE